MARSRPLLLLALSCAPACGLHSAGSSASREGSVAYVEGLTADNWQYAFDPTSAWQPNIQVPPRATSVRSIQEHMRVVQDSARAIGRQMGVPYVPHDFGSALGDGSVEGIRAKTHQRFGEMARHVPGISGVTDFLLAQVGNGDRPIDPETAFDSYSMVAQRLGAKSLANQLAPLLRSTAPPNPGMMFNTIGNILAAREMPQESIDFFRDMARMYSGSGPPSHQVQQVLQNRTLAQLKNRTLPLSAQPTAQRYSEPDYYKSTSNLGIVLFQLPCKPGSKVCFALTSEFYQFKSGPGFFNGVYNPGVPGGHSVALGIATQTPWSFISTPFYVYPKPAVGHEYDLKFSGGEYAMPQADKSTVSVLVKLRDSSDCLGTGSGTPVSPRVDTCPMAALVLTGGVPQLYSVLEILPVRAVLTDSLVSFYDVMKYGGAVMEKIQGELLPGWAWAGFYRQVVEQPKWTPPWRSPWGSPWGPPQDSPWGPSRFARQLR